jgi:hypothetical protein
MITKEKYLDFIKTREEVEGRAYEVANLLNKLRPTMWQMYLDTGDVYSDTGDVYFYDTSVSLNTNEYFRGSYDSTSMDFKSDYLFMTDDEITEDAKILIEEFDEKVRQIREAKDKLIIEQVEEKERKEYLRLKWKYDNSN